MPVLPLSEPELSVPEENTSPAPTVPAQITEEPAPITPVPDEGNTLLRLAVAGDVLKLNENQEKINKRIHEDGLDVNVFFYSVDALNTDGLKVALSGENNYDIVTTGIWPDHIGDAKFVSSGYFYDFSEYLKTEKGQKLKAVFTDDEWKTVSIEGAVYNFPGPSGYNVYGMDVYSYGNGNVEASLNGLLDACRMSDIQDRNKLFIMKSWNTVFALSGITSYLPAPFVVSEEKFVNPFTYPALLEVREKIADEDGKELIYNDYNKFSEYENGVYAALVSNVSLADFGENKTSVMPKYMYHTNGFSLGIAEKSENKEKALELMYLIYTDKELADMLVYECRAEYEDGIVSNIDGDVRGDVWGIGAFASPIKSDKVKDRRQAVLDWEKNAAWDYAGFVADLSDEERNTLKKSESEWMEWTQSVNQKLPSQDLIDSLDPIIEKLNVQFEEWKKNEK